MNSNPGKEVASHYESNDLVQRIIEVLQGNGTDLNELQPDDLAAVDHFHTRGRQSTVELVALAKSLGSIRNLQILDMGCGIGGTARFLASNFSCRLTGIDLTADFIEAADSLSRMVGLDEACEFVAGSVTELPFEDESFDLVWTEHVQMNVSNKSKFYCEASRVLKPGGRFVFHDVLQGTGDLKFPVPWASRPEISFLITAEELKNKLTECGLSIVKWQSACEDSQKAFQSMVDRHRENDGEHANTLGLHLLMGADTLTKVTNYLDGLNRGAVTVAMGVAVKE